MKQLVVAWRQQPAVSVLACLLLVLALGYADCQADPNVGPATVIPYTTTQTGQMLIVVQLTGVNGKTEYETFLLDSGAGSCGVSASLARKLGLSPKPALGPDGKQIKYNDLPAQDVIVPLLKVGAISSVNAPMVLSSDKETSQVSGILGTDVQGVIGGNLLAFMPAVYDFAHQLVGFFDHSPVTPADLKAVSMQDALVVPLHQPPGQQDKVACRVGLTNGDKTDAEDLVIDTGSNVTSLSAPAAQRLGLSQHARPSASYGEDGKEAAFKANLTLLTLGGLPGAAGKGVAPSPALTVQGLKVLYPQGQFPDYAPPALGLDVLTRYRVLLDYGAGKMYLLPLTPPATADTPPAPATAPTVAPPTQPAAPAPAARSRRSRGTEGTKTK